MHIINNAEEKVGLNVFMKIISVLESSRNLIIRMNILQSFGNIIHRLFLSYVILRITCAFATKPSELLQYYITEELPKGTVVASGESLGPIYSNAIIEKPVIINQKDIGVSSFTLRHKPNGDSAPSGVSSLQLVISDRVDRETICPRQHRTDESRENYGPEDFQIATDSTSVQSLTGLRMSTVSEKMDDFIHTDCTVHLRVATMKDGVQSIHQIIVYIQDINDNAPTWSMHSTVVNFKDGDPVGTKRPIPLATDSDFGINAVIIYKLQALNSGIHNAFNTDSSYILSTDMFELYKERSTLAHVNGRLFLIAKHDIDREASPNGWDLVLVASNIGSNQALSSQLRIHVNVTDINDNAPRFTQPVYQPQLPNHKLGVIPETLAVGQIILRVQATDADEGINGAITYDFVPNPGVDRIRYFFELTQVGELRIRNRLQVDKLAYQDKDASKYYSLPTTVINIDVQAVDGAEPAYARTGYATVKLRVEDMDDEAPNIRIHPVRTWSGQHEENASPQTAVELAVPENEMLGQLVGLIEVSDPDNAEQEMLRCNIASTENNLFRLSQQDTSGHEFRLYTAGKLDREQTARTILTIECRDLADHISSINVGVNIVDVNDHSPQFKESLYRFQILEDDGETFMVDNSRNRTWLTATGRVFVKATDADEGENKHIVYSLQSTSDSTKQLISINPDTGEIFAHGPFDREQVSIHRFVVLAVDHGDPPRTGTCVVEVTVLDVNDNPPMFDPEVSSSGGYTFAVLENQPPGTRVGKVEAYDADHQPAALSSFEIPQEDGEGHSTVNKSKHRLNSDYLKFSLQDEPDAKAFWIDPKAGVLITRAMLDREKQAVYTVHVVVRDMSLDVRSGKLNKNPHGHIRAVNKNGVEERIHEVSCLVTVTVEDENDNEPVFIRPNTTNHMVLLDPAAIPGQSLHQLYATDLDEGANGLVTYAIRGGNADGLFNVDPRTGLLYLESQIPREVATYGLRSNSNSSPKSSYVGSSGQSAQQNGANMMDIAFHPTYLLSLEACDHGQPPRCSTFPNLQIQIRTPNSPSIEMPSKETYTYDKSGVGKYLLHESELMSHGEHHRSRSSDQLTAAEIVIITLSVFFSVIVIATVISVCFLRKNHQYTERCSKKANASIGPTTGRQLPSMELINQQTESTHALYSSKLSPVIQSDRCGGQWTFANHTEDSEAGTLPRAGIHLTKSVSHSMMDTRFQCVPDIVLHPQLMAQHYARKTLPCEYGSVKYNYPSGTENTHDDYQALDNWNLFESGKLPGTMQHRQDMFPNPHPATSLNDSIQMGSPRLRNWNLSDNDVEQMKRNQTLSETLEEEVVTRYPVGDTDAVQPITPHHSKSPKERCANIINHNYARFPKSSFV